MGMVKMLINRRIFYLISIAALFLSSISFAWTVAPNAQYYENVSINSWNTILYGHTVLNNSFALINITFPNTFTSSLSRSFLFLTEYINVTAYNSQGQYLGEVPVYPYPSANGILVANQTITGQPYNSITIWLGQVVLNPNYNNTHIGVFPSGYVELSPIHLFIYEQAAPELAGISGLDTSISYSNNALTAGTLRLFFNVSKNYHLQVVSSNNYNKNLSLMVVPNQYGNTWFNYTTNGIIEKLISYGAVGTSTQVSAINTNTIDFYLLNNTAAGGTCSGLISNPLQQYKFIDPTLFVNNSCIGYVINNATKNYLGGYVVAFQPHIVDTTYPNGHSYQYELAFNFSNLNYSTNYYLMPAATVNYTASNVIAIPANQIIVPRSLNSCAIDQGNGWYGDYNYRQQINVTSWNYTFKSNIFNYSAILKNNQPASLGNVIINNVTNSGFLYLTLRHYAAMGNVCQYVSFDAYNNVTKQDLGLIPFSIYNCTQTSSIATFILRNTTTVGHNYNWLYVYYDSRLGISISQNNQSILNAWRFKLNAPISSNVIAVHNYIINFTSSFSPQSFLEASPGGVIPIKLNGTSTGQQRILGYAPNGGSGWVSWLNGSNDKSALFLFTNKIQNNPYNSFFLISPSVFGMSGCWGGNTCIYNLGDLGNISEASILAGGTYTRPFYELTLNLSNSQSAIFTRFYTSYAVVNNTASVYPCPISSNSSLGNPVTSIPSSSTGAAIANSFIANIGTINATTTNRTLSGLGLLQTQDFFGFTLQKYYLFMTLLVFTFLVLFVAGDNLIPISFGLLAAWILGIWNIQLIPFEVLISFIYVIYELIERLHKKESVVAHGS